MVGAGRVAADPDHNGGKGSLSHLADNDPKYKPLKDKSGGWVARDDVSVWFLGRKGKLAPGFGSNGGTIGPELGFGNVVGDALKEPVLLIKTAWGGKSLMKDFRPPSSGGEVGPRRPGDQERRSDQGGEERQRPHGREGQREQDGPSAPLSA